MIKSTIKTTHYLLCLAFLLSACASSGSATTTATAALPTDTPSPTVAIQPTATPLLVTIAATVWTEEPVVPILNLHQFKPDGISPSDKSGHKMQLGDLRASLENLYDAGFSLVSLEDWLSGDLTVPSGRRPLVLTMDDLFYTNQILLGEDVYPLADTGIGVIWQFSQEHPDFGFHLALFSILGDKYYPFDPNSFPGSHWAGKDWEDEFARVIIWCIEHDAMVYNHTFMHGYLGLVEHPISMDAFIEQVARNDERLRELLTIGGREDLIPRLGNILALPGGAAPQSTADWETLRAYANPEGLPLQAVMHVYSAATDPSALTYLSPPYNPEFDRYEIPRITGSLYYIQYVVDERDRFPSAQACELSLDETRLVDPTYLAGHIGSIVQAGYCPAGVYYLAGLLFDARTIPVSLIDLP